MDAVHASLQQHSQGTSTAAFLQGFAAAVQPGDFALELGLLLLEAAAGALLQGQGFGQLLHLLLLRSGGLQHLLPAAFGGLQLLLGTAMAGPFLLLFGAELGQALLVLSQPFL